MPAATIRMTTSAAAASAIGCEPIWEMPPVFATWEATSIMGLHGPSESQSSFALTTIAGAGPTQKRHKTTLAAAHQRCGRGLSEARARAARDGTGRGGEVARSDC